MVVGRIHRDVSFNIGHLFIPRLPQLNNTIMKKLITLSTPFILAMCMGFYSCVPTRDLKKAQFSIHKLQEDSTYTHNSLDECNTVVKNLQNEKKGLLTDKAGLLTEKTGLEYDNLNMQNNLYNLSTTSKMTIEDQAKRLKNLQGLIQSQKDASNKLKKSISDALINFKGDEISVNIKDGKVYVSLEEKLLFQSGSADVDPKGVLALIKLAGVITSTKDIIIMIEGHTDNVPIKNSKFEDNWALSTGRALSIVRILVKTDGFDPKRIIASGRGEFYPVKSNETAEGRASNRRTEVILSPNLNELYKLLNQ
jgi:chemotaxis protein MotB